MDFLPPPTSLSDSLQAALRTSQQALASPRRDSTAFQTKFSTEDMRLLLDTSHGLEHRKKVIDFLATHPLMKNKHMVGMTTAEQRELVRSQVEAFQKSGLVNFLDSEKNLPRWAATMEPHSFLGNHFATKFGVHYSLFGGSVLKLGTDKHWKKYAQGINSLQVRGAFCLTELGKGSNAKDVQTRAVFDVETDEFVLHTPHNLAQKFWIGNLALHCTHAVVFAQLNVSGVERGVHAFIVRIRDENGELTENVRVKDCGPKCALNGIDNGRLWLTHKRIPRDNLLNRYGDVTRTGEYITATKSNNVRFTKMISALVFGRIGVAQGALNAAKVGISIAIKYALSRRQFGKDEQLDEEQSTVVPEVNGEIPLGISNETLLLDYLSHQLRLFPLLAKIYSLQLTMNSIKTSVISGVETGKLHVMVSGMKAACTWLRRDVLQECREACGGMGFHATSRIGILRNDFDIDVTWEGDNTVLLQQVSGALLKQLRGRYFSGGYSGMVAYLQDQALLELRDKNPIQKNVYSQKHLRDMDMYKRAFEYREMCLLSELVERMKNVQGPAAVKWNESLDLIIELGQAHVERNVVQQLRAVLATCDKSLRPMLRVVCSLYCVTVISERMGYFMSYNYFSASKARAFREEKNQLCKAMRPHALDLVKSFGIPDELLDSPLAGDWNAQFQYPKVPGHSNL